MSRKVAATLTAAESDPNVGRYRTSIYLDSDSALNKLSKTNNSLVFNLPQQVKDIAALKVQNFAMTQTISPFDADNRYLRFTVSRPDGIWLAGTGGSWTMDLDLGVIDVGFDRASIDELGDLMTALILSEQQAGNMNWSLGNSIAVETGYVRGQDAIEFKITVANEDSPDMNLNYGFVLSFPDPAQASPSYADCSTFFGLFPPTPDIDAKLRGISGFLGVIYNNPYTIEGGPFPSTYSKFYYSVISNGALRLEGNTELIVKLERCSFRSAHSAPLNAPSDEKSSNIFEKVRLGSARGSIVQYTDGDFPISYYNAVKDLQGQLKFTFWTGNSTKPAFQYNTAVHITLYVEYNDD